GTARRGGRTARRRRPAPRRGSRGAAPAARARPDRPGRSGARRGGARPGFQRGRAGGARVDRPLPRPARRGPAPVSGRRSLRGRPARRHRAHRHGGAARAGLARLVSRARRGPPGARPWRLGARDRRPPRRRRDAAAGRRGRPARRLAGRGARGGAPGRGRPAHGARVVRGDCTHRRHGRGRTGRGARVGTAAPRPRRDRRGRRPSRTPDPRLPGQRGGTRGAPRARAGEGGDPQVVKRRAFLGAVGRTAALAMAGDLAGRWPGRLAGTGGQGAQLLVPMDDAQADHLKAYGVAYRAVQAGMRVEWLLNYRGGAFLVPDGPVLRRDAALAGVTVEGVDDAAVTAVRGEIAANNMDAVPLEKAPKVAVYVPPNAPPWDDAVTMALRYAGIPSTRCGTSRCWPAGCRGTTGCTCTTRTLPASTRSSICSTRARPGSRRWCGSTPTRPGGSGFRPCRT